MPPIQTTYATEISQAFEGMIANTEPNNLISRRVETGPVRFGKAVKQGSAEGLVDEADDAADVVRGVAVRSYEAIHSEFRANDEALIMTRGVIWVTAGAAVSEGDAVYMIPASGKFTSVATDNLAIPRAIFDGDASADGDLVKIRLQ